MRRRPLRVGLWAIGILGFGYFVLGPILYSLFIGLDWNAYLGGPAIEKRSAGSATRG